VFIVGALNKTEAADTTSATGHLVVGVTVVATSATAGCIFTRKLYKAGGSCIFPAPYIYVDSAVGALPDWPVNTVVTLGQRFGLRLGIGQNYKYIYAEITQAGTTAGTNPSAGVIYGMGFEQTSFTAKWRVRYFHGWSRARPTIEAGLLPADWITSLAWSWTILMASTHTQTTYAGRCDLTNEFSSGSYINFPGSHVISVSKAAYPPTTYAAGASLVVTGTNQATDFSSTNVTGTVRGVTLGHDNTVPSSAEDEYATVYPWSPNVRWVDCTFQTYRAQNVYPTRATGAHGNLRKHSLRCTVKSLHGTDPVPVLVANGVMLEAPTINRTNVASSPLANVDQSAGGLQAPSYMGPDGYLFLLGADLTGFTSATTAWGNVSGTSAALVGGAPLHTFGTLFKATANTNPSTLSLSTAWSAYGTVVVGEMNTGNHENVTRQIPWTSAPWPAMPSTRRNTTYVRSGGASDALGSFSYECTIDVIPRVPYHFEFFNTKIDESFTITIEFEWSSTGTGLTTLKDEDVWLEAAYLKDANTDEAELVFSFDKYNRRGLIYNDATGPTALSTSASTWSGALGSAVKQRVSVIVTPKKIGPIKVWLGVWLCPWTNNIASSTSFSVYIDPLPVLS